MVIAYAAHFATTLIKTDWVQGIFYQKIDTINTIIVLFELQ